MRDSTTATVTLVYLARLREAFGRAGEPLEVSGPTTVAALLETLRARGGPWASELAAGRAVRVAVNYDMATPASAVAPGDEVALFPPVTGG